MAEQKPGHLTLLRGKEGNGQAEFVERHAEGFNQPYGLAWRDEKSSSPTRTASGRSRTFWATCARDTVPPKKAEEVPREQRKPSPHMNAQELITRKGVFGVVRGHANRPLAIDPKTGALFVGVGSSGNIGIEPEVKATIQRFERERQRANDVCPGVRNTCGLASTRIPVSYGLSCKSGTVGRACRPISWCGRSRDLLWLALRLHRAEAPGFADKAPDKVKASKFPDLRRWAFLGHGHRVL